MKASLRIPVLAVLTVALAALPAFAQKKHQLTPEQEAGLQKAVKLIESWEHDPVLVKEIEAQNAKNRNQTQAEIDTIDKAWMAGGENELAAQMLSNTCATHLKKLIEANPAFGESFAMDNKGGNVCMTNRTSDYWQGDEAKWQKTYPTGKTFVDDPKYDTSAKAILMQVSVPIFDGTKPVGALTVGINTSALK